MTGGRVALVSCVSTVALMAFCPGTSTAGVNARTRRGTGVRFGTAYLEKFKEHVVEVGRHVDDVQRLSGAFGCEETHKRKKKGFSVGVGGDRSSTHPATEAYC